MNPPDDAIGISVDEKKQSQALEHTQPMLPLGFGCVEGVTIDLPFDIQRFRLAMAWHPRAREDKAVGWLRDRFLAVRAE